LSSVSGALIMGSCSSRLFSMLPTGLRNSTGSISNGSWLRAAAINLSPHDARSSSKLPLDTNACIALINGKPPSVRAKFQKVTDKGAKVFVSSIAAFELWYGVAKSSGQEFDRKRLEAFFAGPLHSIPFANEDDEIAGAIRADLEASGKPIGADDLLIAGQAMRNKLTLVTATYRSLSE